MSVKYLGASNLYWETYSGEVSTVTPTATSPLRGILRFCIDLLPVACTGYPTLFIYIWIIKVNESIILEYSYCQA